MVYEMSGKTTVKRADFHSYERIFPGNDHFSFAIILPHMYVVPCNTKIVGWAV